MDKPILDTFTAIAESDALVDLLRHENLTLATRNRKLRDEIGQLQKEMAETSKDNDALREMIERLNAQRANLDTPENTQANPTKSADRTG